MARLALFPVREVIIPENGGIIRAGHQFLRRRGEPVFSHIPVAEPEGGLWFRSFRILNRQPEGCYGPANGRPGFTSEKWVLPGVLGIGWGVGGFEGAKVLLFGMLVRGGVKPRRSFSS